MKRDTTSRYTPSTAGGYPAILNEGGEALR